MQRQKKPLFLFFAILALTGLALGLSDGVFANYFKDAYNVDAFQRGLIEFPRELPGFLCVFVVSALSFLGDIRLAVVAQSLSVVGLVVLGLFTPAFGFMLVFLFINSLGMHLYGPVENSIGLSLAEEGSYGRVMGKFNGVRVAFSMIAGVIVFVGFKTGVFSFVTPIKPIFLISAGIFLLVIVLLLVMWHRNKADKATRVPRPKFVFRKEYKLYYLLAVLFGARKQIMFVYGPWVLIELLGLGADAMAILAIASSAVGIFLMPAVGRAIDRFGTARVMAVEAGAFFTIYIAYGVLSAGISGGWLLVTAVPVIAIAFAINMADRMTMQFDMVRAIYLRSIALTPEDVTPTLSVGMTLDHVLSILGAVACGFLWSEWGPQYVFGLAALIAVGNMIVALYIKRRQPKPELRR